jgi:hypothetical protein
MLDARVIHEVMHGKTLRRAHLRNRMTLGPVEAGAPAYGHEGTDGLATAGDFSAPPLPSESANILI